MEKGFDEANLNASYAMRNNASDDNSTSFTFDQQWRFTFGTIISWLIGFICIFGIIGNILSVKVLGRHKQISPMFVLLKMLAISDMLFLMFMFLLHIFPIILHKIDPFSAYFFEVFLISKFVWPMSLVTQMSTVWITVAISIERYITVNHPLRRSVKMVTSTASILPTTIRIKRASFAIFFLSAVYNIPRFFEYKADLKDLRKSDFGDNEIYRYLYCAASYFLVLFFIPLILIISLNIRVVLALNDGQKRWERMNLRQKADHKLTRIALAIVVVFFVCGMPALAVNILEVLIGHYEYHAILTRVANTLVVFNSAVNFMIYCLLGKKFRRLLKDMLLQYKNCHRKSRIISRVNSYNVTSIIHSSYV
ncbi:unnamed protein product [Owenia fusiformis]|uniref:G-protein coupled receptors family 1 profile domain-containing protein n=1 Tax=Owenia fusiformis TaxID=6347 RepID=A0A8S4NQS5_OWEFU|nr:unnamed protein product [Owenia fusiformis]